MTEDRVQVAIDDRMRLLAAMLAVTSWPEDEQQRKGHGTHIHARNTRRLLQAHDKHPAVTILQALLDRGVPLEELFGYLLQLEWPGLSGGEQPTWAPPAWPRHLVTFYQQSGLAEWWQSEAEVWEQARQKVEALFANARLCTFLEPFVGPVPDALIFLPNLCYPTDMSLGAAVDGRLYCITPPRVAVGNNPPWPFDEDPAHLYRAALMQYGRLLLRRYLRAHADALAEASTQPLPVTPAFARLYPTWEAQLLALVGLGLVVIYLQDFVSEQEAQSYLLMERKVQGLTELPGTVSVLRRYLRGREDGTYREFVDFLPYFGKHLRVARTIMAL